MIKKAPNQIFGSEFQEKNTKKKVEMREKILDNGIQIIAKNVLRWSTE